jgi:hypothetical protein
MSMTRAQFRKQLQNGLNAVFGLEYKRYPELWRDIFEVKSSEKAFEEQVIQMGLGGAAVKPEGSAITYDEGMEGWVARFVHITVALAFAITEEAIEDTLYGDLGATYSKSLARSLQYTKEVRGASILNNGFDTNYPMGDAKPVFSATHPLMGGGTFANMLGTAADISEKALEDALTDIAGFVDERGIPVMMNAKRLVITRQQKYAVHRILKSTKRVGTANNDPNALKDMGVFDEPSVNVYLSDSDAWFIITDCPEGFQHFKRKGVSRGVEGDFETGNMRYKARERYSFGTGDPRCGYASAGA